MERTLTPDEKIKRAEEIYYRKKMQSTNRNSTRVNVSQEKDFRLLKKMFLQIAICILIYIIFYMIQSTNYIFSEDVIKRTNEILSYDINIQKLYSQAKDKVNSFLNTDIKFENEITDKIVNDGQIEPPNVQEDISAKSDENISGEQTQEAEKSNEENIGGENIEIIEEKTVNLTQMELDAKNIIETKSLILPLKGTITSRYGPRNPTTATVPKYHTGIDIAVNEGTVFIASMEGTVETVSSVGDYGNHVKIVNGDVMTLYAHCKIIYVKEGDKIAQGQQIGEVGATGNVTGPHLHFEIRKENKYVDPDLILNF